MHVKMIGAHLHDPKDPKSRMTLEFQSVNSDNKFSITARMGEFCYTSTSITELLKYWRMGEEYFINIIRIDEKPKEMVSETDRGTG